MTSISRKEDLALSIGTTAVGVGLLATFVALEVIFKGKTSVGGAIFGFCLGAGLTSFGVAMTIMDIQDYMKERNKKRNVPVVVPYDVPVVVPYDGHDI